jgi:hypothetical protein
MWWLWLMFMLCLAALVVIGVNMPAAPTKVAEERSTEVAINEANTLLLREEENYAPLKAIELASVTEVHPAVSIRSAGMMDGSVHYFSSSPDIESLSHVHFTFISVVHYGTDLLPFLRQLNELSNPSHYVWEWVVLEMSEDHTTLSLTYLPHATIKGQWVLYVDPTCRLVNPNIFQHWMLSPCQVMLSPSWQDDKLLPNLNESEPPKLIHLCMDRSLWNRHVNQILQAESQFVDNVLLETETFRVMRVPFTAGYSQSYYPATLQSVIYVRTDQEHYLDSWCNGLIAALYADQWNKHVVEVNVSSMSVVEHLPLWQSMEQTTLGSSCLLHTLSLEDMEVSQILWNHREWVQDRWPARLGWDEHFVSDTPYVMQVGLHLVAMDHQAQPRYYERALTYIMSHFLHLPQKMKFQLIIVVDPEYTSVDVENLKSILFPSLRYRRRVEILEVIQSEDVDAMGQLYDCDHLILSSTRFGWWTGYLSTVDNTPKEQYITYRDVDVPLYQLHHSWKIIYATIVS